MNKDSYRADIDGLRAIAVLGVVLFHVGFSPIGGGFVGVDVFFVISGFLITRLIYGDVVAGSFSFADFYLRRVRRLFPALFFTLAFSLIAATLLLSPLQLQRVGGASFFSVASASNFYFWSESGYFDTEANLKPLLHMWSLSVEEQFYLVWPAFLFLLVTHTHRVVTPAVIILAGFASVYYAEQWLHIDPAAAFYLAPFRVVEFAIGAILVWTVRYQPSNKLLLEPAVLAGLAMVLYPILAYSKDTAFPGMSSLIPCLGTALLIQSGTAKYAGKLLNNPLTVGIGLISYSLYLIHWPLIVFYQNYKLDSLERAERYIIVVVSIVLAALMYRYVEKPFRKLGRTEPWLSRRQVVIGGIIGALMIAVPALAMWNSAGWLWRLPTGIATIAVSADGVAAFHRRSYGGAECSSPRCVMGPDGKTPSFVVIGDSHARHYVAGLQRIFPDESFIVFESGACDFYSLSMVKPKDVDDQRCQAARQEAFSYIKKHRVPVLVSQIWYSSFRTELSDGESIHTFESVEEFVEFVSKEISKLRKNLGSPLIIVSGNVPTFGRYGSPFDCILRPSLLQYSNCETTNRSSLPSIRGSINNKLSASLGEKRITFFNPFEALCDVERCRNLLGSSPIYSDAAHLSKTGSEYVVRHFKSMLAILAGGSPKGGFPH